MKKMMLVALAMWAIAALASAADFAPTAFRSKSGTLFNYSTVGIKMLQYKCGGSTTMRINREGTAWTVPTTVEVIRIAPNVRYLNYSTGTSVTCGFQEQR